MRAASSLFAHYSFAKVTMEQIATSLNMVPAALYHYFNDKEELIYSCYIQGLLNYEHEMQAAIEPGIDGLEIVRRFLRGRLKPESQHIVMFTDIDALPEKYSNQVHQQRWKNAEKLADIIKRGVADGSMTSDKPLLSAIAVISIFDWLFFWYSKNDYYSRADAIDAIDDIITHGVYSRHKAIPEPPEAPCLEDFLATQKKFNKRETKYDHMLRVAADNFNRKGVMGASLESIAKDVGISRAGIYYHFDDKEELLLACLQRGHDHEKEISAYLTNKGYKNDAHVIQNTRLLLMLHATPYGPKCTYHNINYLTKDCREKYICDVLKTIGSAQQDYKNAIVEGDFRHIDVYFAQRVITGMCHWYPIWFNSRSDWSPLTIADHYTHLFLYGLKPRKSTSRA
ncbi:MAG: TetR family transcriptional regulator [Oceanospirillaceae bacterium]|nr:TetR family transcriptional regulator [Oceanospirillaceae bacterium]